MLITEAFPSKYLKSTDLQGRVAKLKIADIKYETIGTDQKLVMYFQGKERGMVLNKTNARTIAEVFGSDTDNWLGGEIEVFSMKVDFQGRMVDGLRVRMPPPRQAQPQRPPAAPPPQSAPPMEYAGGDMDDDIPFAPEWR